MVTKQVIGVFLVSAMITAGCAPAGPPKPSTGIKPMVDISQKTWQEIYSEEKEQADKQRAYEDARYKCKREYFEDAWKDDFMIGTIILAPIGLLNYGFRGIGYAGCRASVEKPDGIVKLTREEKEARRTVFMQKFLPYLSSEIARYTLLIGTTDKVAQSSIKELLEMSGRYQNAKWGFEQGIKLDDSRQLQTLWLGGGKAFLTNASLHISFSGSLGELALLYSYDKSSGKLLGINIAHPAPSFYIGQMTKKETRFGCYNVFVSTKHNYARTFSDKCIIYSLNEKEQALAEGLGERILNQYIVLHAREMRGALEEYEKAKDKIKELENELELIKSGFKSK